MPREGGGGGATRTAVIGGAGFIGRRLVEALGQALVLDRSAELGGANALRVDVRDRDGIVRALNGMETVYLLAAEHADNVEPATLYHDVNVGGVENVIAGARTHRIQRIIFTSSVAIYGLNAPGASESAPPDPFNDYGRSKWEAERRLVDWAKEDPSRELLIVRPSVVFGEGNRGNVYNLLRQVASGRFVRVGRGNNRKSMAYVENLAAFLASPPRPTGGIQVFNYADKPDMPMNEFLAIAQEEMGVRIPGVAVPYPAGLAVGLTFDLLARLTRRKFPVSSVRIRKFCAETTVGTDRLEATGFQPPYTLEEGLRRTIRSEFRLGGKG